MYVDIPEQLTEALYIQEFGLDAFRFYKDRIQQRMGCGRVYLHPLKTMYLWAKKDKAANQGFFGSVHPKPEQQAAEKPRKKLNGGGSNMTFSEQLFASQRAQLDAALEARAARCDWWATDPGEEDVDPWDDIDPSAVDAEE